MRNKFLAISALAMTTLVACEKKETVTTNEQMEVSTPAANAIQYNVATGESNINWEGGKVSGDKHTGTIKLKDGQMAINNGKVTNGNFTLDMGSIAVTDITDAEKKAMLEGHLKGSTAEKADHFFNVSKYPTGKFEITSVTDKDGKQLVTGNLTIKEKTKSISFPATVTVSENEVIMNSDEFMINRTDFDVNFNSGKFFQDLGDNVINDEIKIKIAVKAVK